MSTGVICLDYLPIELLHTILSHLDGSPPSTASLYGEPCTTLTDSVYQPLKNFSQTCRSHRSLSAPFLFKYSRIKNLEFTDQETNVCTSARPHERLYVYSEVKDFLTFVVEQNLSRHVCNLVITAVCHIEGSLLSSPQARPSSSLGDIWHLIFSVIRPYTITICAPPSTLAFLTSCRIDLTNAWAFDIPCHTLQLRLSSNFSRTNYPKPNRSMKLFDIIPWTHCTLNEGSSVQVYNTYEYYSMVQPSILNDRFCQHDPDGTLQSLTSLRSFDYIAIFPLLGQVSKLQSFLKVLPDMQRVTMQLAPRKENKILEDGSRVLRSLFSDLWMEFENIFFFVALNIVHPKTDCSIRELKCLDYQQEGLGECLDRGGSIMSRHWRTIGNGHWEKIDTS